MESIQEHIIGFEEKELYLSEDYLPFSAFVSNLHKDVPCHFHNYMEMLYITSGSAIVHVNNKSFDFSEGDFLVINSNDLHYIKSVGLPEFLVLQFKSSMINPDLELPFEGKYFLPLLKKDLIFTKDIRLHHGNTLENLMLEIVSDFKEKFMGYELNIKANIYKIFSWLIKNDFIEFPNIKGITPSSVSKISVLLEHICSNFDKELTIEDASKMVYMSYHHFCRTFKKVTGKTFITYLNFVRLRESEKLLIMSDKSISEIAISVGFSNTSYYTRTFKKEKGIPPLLYRKHNRNAT
ncbi:MAG TPA: helix-turn-helix domain-containing protein [Ruminiclostridium sp.]